MPFAPFCQYISHICGIRSYKEIIRKAKSEFTKESVTQKVKPMVIEVTESIASSKQDVKWNENPQKNHLERVTTTRRKREKREAAS